MTGLSDLAAKPLWWRRLRVRFVAVLGAIGLFCVASSGFFVWVTVHYLDNAMTEQASAGDDAIELSSNLYNELNRTQREALALETRSVAEKLARLGAGEREAALTAEKFIVARIARARIVSGQRDLQTGKGVHILPSDRHDPLIYARAAIDENSAVELAYERKTELDDEHAHLGAIRHSLGTVAIGPERIERAGLEAGILWALLSGSVVVVAAAIAFGSFLARKTTRALSEIAGAMRRVSSGELNARVGSLSQDEVGQLGRSLNAMLDEIEQGRKNLVYLQRIGAWQDLARRLAHEIKNPLTPIQLAVQQVRDTYDGSDLVFSRLLRDSVEIVEDEIESLRRLVSSFSLFARLPDVRLEPVDANRVLAEFDRAYGHLTERGEDRLEVREYPNALEIEADRQLLKNVLVNLVENAVLSARENQVPAIHVRVEARPLEESGQRWVEIAVDDNGPGVPFEQRELIFEPYYTSREHGTGLGLAIAKKVVLDHGGMLFVRESDLGGASFVLRIPRIRPSNGPAGSSVGVTARILGSRPSMIPPRIER
jgi:signal transduction histidine kinase